MVQCIKMVFAVPKREYQNGTVYQNGILSLTQSQNA